MAETLHNEPVTESAFIPVRSEALLRLQEFCERAGAYAQGRNFDRPTQQAVSELSPYIRYRIISEREVVQEILKVHAYENVETFIQEVVWRTYWKGYLEMRRGIWERYGKDVGRLRNGLDHGLASRLEQAINGETGIDCFDAWTRELRNTGWLHNHARMWYASIWIFTLELPWQLGAAFFLSYLLDGDPASNTLSWRWIAGLHTPGKHYLARAGNIRKYTDGRFHPTGQLNEKAMVLPEDNRVPLNPLAPVSSLRDIHFPSLSSCPAGLLVTPDDLSPESGELSETPFSSLAVFSANDILNSYDAVDNVRAFVSSAVEDAGRRLAWHWDGKVIDCRGDVVHMVGRASPDNVGRRERLRVYAGTVHNWVEAVTTWARNEHLNSIWVMRPATGPWADVLPELKKALRSRGVRLFEYRRRWDTLHWPHATAGYFRFKDGLRERIKRALAPLT